MMKKLILVALITAPLVAQNYGNYNSAPVARPQFMRSPVAVKGNIFGDASLVGWWPMTFGTGSTVRDMSGNGNDGAWSGTKAGTNGYWSAGKIGLWSGYFDGSSNTVTTATSSYPSGTAFTVTSWVKIPSSTAAYRLIFAQGGVMLYINNQTSNQVWFQLNGTAHSTSCTVTVASWKHGALVVSGTSWVAYMNGVQCSSGTLSTAYSPASGVSYIGSYPPWNGITPWYFGGWISDVRIYNRALSQAEIAAIYNAENH
ncbi:MAG: LamG domain-containing protein [Terracidiphilus sp.]|nr:LamG domain-containing protein [Terracidiphilus sp.]